MYPKTYKTKGTRSITEAQYRDLVAGKTRKHACRKCGWLIEGRSSVCTGCKSGNPPSQGVIIHGGVLGTPEQAGEAIARAIEALKPDKGQ